QPFDEAFELLSPQHRQDSKLFSRRPGLDPGEAEGRIPILMTRKPVPQAHDQRADQFVRRIDVSNSGNLPPHRPSYPLIGDTPIPGEAMLPRNRVRTSWNGTEHR